MEEKLQKLAEAIKKFEGWFAGSISWKNNNPGNLKFSPYMYYQKDGFARFKTYGDGWKALLHQLRIVCNGKSPTYNREAKKLGLEDCSQLTLKQFIEIYAPVSDKNQPDKYAKFLAQELGIDINIKMEELL